MQLWPSCVCLQNTIRLFGSALLSVLRVFCVSRDITFFAAVFSSMELSDGDTLSSELEVVRTIYAEDVCVEQCDGFWPSVRAKPCKAAPHVEVILQTQGELNSCLQTAGAHCYRNQSPALLPHLPIALAEFPGVKPAAETAARAFKACSLEHCCCAHSSVCSQQGLPLGAS